MNQEINKWTQDSKNIWATVVVITILVVAVGSGRATDVEKYLHKHAIIREAAPPTKEIYRGLQPSHIEGLISAREAILFAIQHLENKGVKGIRICEARWIAAPLGGYLIDGKGDFNIGDKHYSTFRIGVRDGTEGKAGEEFVFIGRGEDKEGRVIWYPEPGPDFRPGKGEIFPQELLSYEFLVDRASFESLSSRFK